MAGIATARVIGQIQQVLRDGSAGPDSRSWRVGSVACSRERHHHSGPSYSFGIEVLQAHFTEPGHPAWRLAIVSERWWAGEPDVLIRDTIWLKLIAGVAGEARLFASRTRRRCNAAPAADVTAWLKRVQR